MSNNNYQKPRLLFPVTIQKRYKVGPIQGEQFLQNPFKKVTFMDNNCIVKTIFVTLAGGGFGFVMALFMNAMEMNQYDTGKTKISTKMTIRKDFRRLIRQARGFAIFGFFFSAFECQLERMRVVDDATNSFIAGGLTSMVLAVDVMGPKGLLWTGFGGGMFGFVMYKLQYMFMH